MSVIRRWHYRDRLLILEIARRTCLSLNTVRKYLRWTGSSPVSRCRSGHALDPFVDKLGVLLRRRDLKVAQAEAHGSGGLPIW